MSASGWRYQSEYSLCRAVTAARDAPADCLSTGLDQVANSARHVLDRHGGIDPVLVEQVDGVNAQLPERLLRDAPDVLRPAVELAGDLPAVQPHLEAGHLRRVLADWCLPFPGYHLYYPSCNGLQ